MIDGTYENVGMQLSGDDRGAIVPPRIASDVLSQWKYGGYTEGVELFLLPDNRLSIVLLDSSEIRIYGYEQPIDCNNDEIVIERSSTGGSEGYYGTTDMKLRLRMTPDGSDLLIHVFKRSVGRFIMIFPHTEVSERQFVFKKKTTLKPR